MTVYYEHAGPHDERHCGCVLTLRAEVERLKAENERLVKAMDVFLSDDSLAVRYTTNFATKRIVTWLEDQAQVHLAAGNGESVLASGLTYAASKIKRNHHLTKETP